MRYVILDNDGYPLALGEAPALPEGAVELPGLGDLGLYLIQRRIDGAWTPRPRIEVAHDGADLVMTAGPALLASLRVIDMDTMQVLAEAPIAPGDVIDLAEPGRYAIEIEAPRPWLPLTMRLEVDP